MHDVIGNEQLKYRERRQQRELETWDDSFDDDPILVLVRSTKTVAFGLFKTEENKPLQHYLFIYEVAAECLHEAIEDIKYRLERNGGVIPLFEDLCPTNRSHMIASCPFAPDFGIAGLEDSVVRDELQHIFRHADIIALS